MAYIIGAIVSLAILITVHEFGHFLAARMFGVTIEKFSLGFGPKLLSFNWDNIDFRVSLIPLGGYVKMKGESPEEGNEGDDSFVNKTWWQRAIIAFAGPFANFLLALIIFILSFSIGRSYEDQNPIIGQVNTAYEEILKVGDTVLSINNEAVIGWSEIIEYTKNDGENHLIIQRDGEELAIQLSGIDQHFWFEDILPRVDAVIGDVTPGMSAYKAGLMSLDKILEVDDVPIENWYDMRESIMNSPKETVTLLIQRDDKKFVKELKLEDNVISGTKIIGISQYMPVKIERTYSFPKAIVLGTTTTISSIALNYYSLYKVFTNPSSIAQNIGGPVMIVSMSKQTANKSFDVSLMLIAMISIVLMVMNLLPIPILDGGHIFFCFIEGISGKPLSVNVQHVLQNIGLFILLSLTVFAFWNDFDKLFKRSSSLQQNKVQLEQN